MVWPTPSSYGDLQRRQSGFQLLAPRLQERRQLQAGTEPRQRLVHREAGHIRGDLEQHAAGLAEIYGAEVLAVLLLGWLLPVPPYQLAGHLGLLSIVGGTECHVMHRTASHPSVREALSLADIDDATD